MSQTFMNLPGGKEFLTRVDYSLGQSHGVLVSVVVSALSMFSAVGLLGALAISAWNTRKSVNPHLFTRSHVCAYFVSLLLCDVTQATGSLMNIRWYSNMAVAYGPYCTVQGVIKQAADVSTALWTFIIALHTFFIVFLRWNPGKHSLYATLLCGWLGVALIIILGPAALHRSPLGAFFGISGYWCWISDNYPTERIALDYVWVSAKYGGAPRVLTVNAAVHRGPLDLVMYMFVFLSLRGNVVKRGWHIKVHFRRDSFVADRVDNESVSIAKQMLLYPTAYVVLILPIAVCRFVEWSGRTVPDAATFFSDSVFLLSGLVNMTLFVATRRVLPEHSVVSRSLSGRFTRRRQPPTSSHQSPKRVPVPAVSEADSDDVDLEKADPEKNGLRDSMIQVDLTPRVFTRAESPDSEPDSDDDDLKDEVTIRVQSMVFDRFPLPSGATSASHPPPGLVRDSPKRMSQESESRRSSYYSVASDSQGPPSPRSAPLLNPHSPHHVPPPPMSAVPFARPPPTGNWV
ncbi:hypothetical protein B0H21DRAFT_843590 [Amylocystis lapponica]|nr:hypothetical protein B0H21DRAFT_843590 [Amylocystis lapponica]